MNESVIYENEFVLYAHYIKTIINIEFFRLHLHCLLSSEQ